MAEYLVSDAELTEIADDLRDKFGGSAPLAFPEDYRAIIQALPNMAYTIDVDVTNGTATGDAYISWGATAVITIVADNDCILPKNIVVEGASYTYDTMTGVIVLSNPTGAVAITVVCDVLPVKGDIISLDGVTGTFLVLNINDTVAEVLSRQNYSTNSWPSSSGQIYVGSNPDTRCNSDFYNAQSATFRAAIVDKTFRQDRWYRSTTGSPVYKGQYNTSTNYTVSLGSATFGEEITRHCYSLSVQDILDYLEVTTSMDYADSTLKRDNVRAMYNATSGGSWLRSAYVGNTSQAMTANLAQGSIATGANSSSYYIRPAFQIDLSKIGFSIS